MKKTFVPLILLGLAIIAFGCKSTPDTKPIEPVPAEAPQEVSVESEQEAAEKARLEQEAAEKARLEQEAAEKARLEQEAAEKARLAKEAAEKARLEQEAAEKARAEKARLAKEAAEKARAEKARLAKEAAEKAYVASAQLTDAAVMIEQADTSFVSKQYKGGGKMFVSILVKYTGDLTDKDFQHAFFASPADVWELDTKTAQGLVEINQKEKILTVKHLSAGEGDGSVALGKWLVSVTLAGQKPFEKQLEVTGISGQSLAVQQKQTGKKDKLQKKALPCIVPEAKAENEQQALAFPVIYSASRDTETIEIIFSIHDPRIKNAYFYFDVPTEEYYRDSGSMIDAQGKPVNGCRSFSTDGKKCQYVLRKDANNSAWFNKVTRCFLVVSDVNRVASPWEERNRTISAASPITK